MTSNPLIDLFKPYIAAIEKAAAAKAAPEEASNTCGVPGCVVCSLRRDFGEDQSAFETQAGEDASDEDQQAPDQTIPATLSEELDQDLQKHLNSIADRTEKLEDIVIQLEEVQSAVEELISDQGLLEEVKINFARLRYELLNAVFRL